MLVELFAFVCALFKLFFKFRLDLASKTLTHRSIEIRIRILGRGEIGENTRWEIQYSQVSSVIVSSGNWEGCLKNECKQFARCVAIN